MSQGFKVCRISGKIFASINVIYPAGWACTCSCGNRELRAGDTSGQWFFSIPFAGRWTITTVPPEGAGEGESLDVVITTAGQIETRKFPLVVPLFDNGDQCEELTGGWEYYIEGDASVTIGESIHIRAPLNEEGVSDGGFLVHTARAIDFTEFDRLEFDVEVLSKRADGSFLDANFGAAKTISYCLERFLPETHYGTGIGVVVYDTGEHSGDVSLLDEPFYAHIFRYSDIGWEVECNFKVKAVRLLRIY